MGLPGSPLMLTVAWLVLLLGVGCQETKKKYPLQGRLMENGAPLQVKTAGLPPGDKGIQVNFHQMGEGGNKEVFPATVNPADATFTVPGLDGKGVPPGKYRVSVSLGAFGTPDKFKDVFGPTKSPLTCDVPLTGKTIVIDVGTKKLTVE